MVSKLSQNVLGKMYTYLLYVAFLEFNILWIYQKFCIYLKQLHGHQIIIYTVTHIRLYFQPSFSWLILFLTKN